MTYWWRISNLLMTYWWHISDVLVTYWRRISDVFVTYWWRIYDVLGTYWWRICDIFMSYWEHSQRSLRGKCRTGGGGMGFCARPQNIAGDTKNAFLRAKRVPANKIPGLRCPDLPDKFAWSRLQDAIATIWLRDWSEISGDDRGGWFVYVVARWLVTLCSASTFERISFILGTHGASVIDFILPRVVIRMSVEWFFGIFNYSNPFRILLNPWTKMQVRVGFLVPFGINKTVCLFISNLCLTIYNYKFFDGAINS